MAIGKIVHVALLTGLLVVGGTTAVPAAQSTKPDKDAPKTGKPTENVTLTGQLTDGGVECQAFRADDGTVYTLTGELGGFKAGDRVTIDAAPVDISTCQQGTTLRIVSIRKAT